MPCNMNCIHYHTFKFFVEWCDTCKLEYRAEDVPAKDILDRRFHGATFSEWKDHVLSKLWTDNILHGQYNIYDSMYNVIGYTLPSWMTDVVDLLLELHARGILEPISYKPSHSRAAFGCFTGGTSESTSPNVSNALDWNYQVRKETS